MRARWCQPATPAHTGCVGELESQLQDVLGLWEAAAGEARSDGASETASLRRQLEETQAALSAAEAGARSSEATMRAEMEQIMRLWEEAQATGAEEVRALQERCAELKAELVHEKAQTRRLQAKTEEYAGYL